MLSGHAFSRFEIKDPRPQQHALSNLRNTLHRFSLKPEQLANLQLKTSSTKYFVKTDAKGYFELAIKPEAQAVGWHRYQVGFVDNPLWYEGEYRIMDDTSLAVISDIDDTILHSRATQFWLRLKLLMFKNAFERRPVNQIETMLLILKDLNHEKLPSDFFYLSNSEWNLYDLLKDFLNIHKLPRGILLLNDLRIGWWDLIWWRGRENRNHHKKNSIKKILQLFPGKPLVLIGDSGQKDIEIYQSVCCEFPKHIKAVIIRDIHKRRRNQNLEKFKTTIIGLSIPVYQV